MELREARTTDTDQPWRQGSVAGHEVVRAMQIAPVDRLPQIDWAGVCLVVISQDCDICHDANEEPFIELMPFVALRDRTPVQVNADNLCRRGRNPRRLVLPIPSFGDAACEQSHRLRLPKGELDGHAPAAELAADDLLCLRRWLGRRYTRAAFPTAFNDRISADKTRARKIDELWKKGKADPVTGVYILCPDTEINDPATDYHIRIVCTYPVQLDENGCPRSDPVTGEFIFDPDAVRHAQEVADNLDEWMGNIRGITVLSSNARPETDFTLNDLRTYKRMELDFRSGPDRAQAFSFPLGVEAP